AQSLRDLGLLILKFTILRQVQGELRHGVYYLFVSRIGTAQSLRDFFCFFYHRAHRRIFTECMYVMLSEPL
ncbi:MAG TPA: hypothetical protein VK826_15640, partial [Bacteroidia bacterium]|nr:hypothetical protein [Bacteroidia bacterium]